jgi:hypothetical protein
VGEFGRTCSIGAFEFDADAAHGRLCCGGQGFSADIPTVTITFDATKSVLEIRGEDTAATKMNPNNDWPVDLKRGTLLLGSSDDPQIDMALQFLSGHVKRDTSVLLFSRQSPHLRNKLTVTYSKTRFVFEMETAVVHNGKWQRGRASWQSKRSAPSA